jgi:heme A synthase
MTQFEISSKLLLLALTFFGAVTIFVWLFLRPQKYKRGLEAKSQFSRSSIFWLVTLLIVITAIGLVLMFLIEK